jgi:gamma-glutamylputrescine oxidase
MPAVRLETHGEPRRRIESVLDATSYYQATATPHDPCPALTEAVEADVAVVGAGFTGLSAALELRARGFTVAVLDQGPIAWGASGRSGGQICTGFSSGLESLEAALGYEATKACFAVAEEGKSLIAERIARYRIDCDLKPGQLICAPRPGRMAGLARQHDSLIRYGYAKTSLLTKSELEERLATTVYCGALKDDGAGHFHPLNYAIGLASALKEAGGSIFENSKVTEIRNGARPVVVSENGEVRARFVVMACNAYIAGLIPQLHSRIMPVASYVITTETLGDNRARALIRNDEAVSDANFVVDYFRLTADRRLLFGGRCSYSGIHPKDLAGNMRPRLLRVFPQLADVAIDYAWGGHIGITYNRLPDVGRIGANVYYVQGFSGQGVALSGILGKLMAETIAGEAERFELFTKVKHMSFPGGPLRRPALVIGMLYYRLRDLLA